MQKFFSLVCAILLVVSASAAPVAQKAQLVKKAPVAVEQMQKVQLEKAQVANFNQLSAAPAVKVNNFKPQALAKVSQATQAEPIVVIIKGNPQIVSKSGKTTIEATGNDDIIYGWVISTESLEAGKTYTYADMGEHNVYRYDNSFTVYEEATDGTFSIDAEKNITASMVTESGTYMVYTNDPTPVTPELSEKYDANGLKYDGTAKAWLPVDSWTLKTGADEKGNYLDGIIPALTGTTDKVYYTIEDDSVLVFESTLLKLVNTGSAIMAASIESFSSEDGSFRLVVGKDGSLKLQNPKEVIGYGAYSYPELEYQGTFGQYAGLTYTVQAPILERDTVEVTADMKLLAEPAKGIIKVSAELNDTTYILEVVGADTVGTFSLADGTLSQQYYYGIVSAAGKSDFAEGEVTIAKNETGLKLNGLMIGVDEKAYVLDWTYTPITERDTVRFSGQGVTISECVNSQTGVQTGWLYNVTDASTGYRFTLQSTVVANKYGTFSYEDKTLGSNYYNVFDPQGNRQQFVEGSITVGEVGDSLILDGELIAEDEKVYVLHFAQSAKVLNYDTDAPFDATFAYNEMDASIKDGVISISLQKGTEIAMDLELYADPAATTIPEGTYTISDSKEAGTALQSTGYGEQGPAACYAATLVVQQSKLYLDDMWFIVEGTVTLSYDEYGKLKVVVDGKNSFGQPVTALVQYEKLDPKSSVDITNAEFAVYEGYVEQYGLMNFYGENAEGYEFDLYAYSDAHIGDFVDAIDFGDCELTTPAGDKVGVIDVYEFVVATEDGKHMTLTAKVLGTDTIQYNITATGFYGALDYDTNAEYVGNFNVVDLTIGQSSKYITIKGINEVGDSINFAFVGSLVDNAIPAGEYTEIMASTGLNAKNNPTTSFVWNAENYLWFVQGGKLTVAEDGSMTFEGLNSYEQNVTINFIAPVPPVTDYYLVGWINGAAYGIEGDIDNFGDYHFVDGKVKATFNELSYVQVKDNNKQIYGTDTYKDPVNVGNAFLFANGREKIGINGGAEYEYTLTVNEDGTLEIFYEEVTTGLNDINADVKANKVVRNGRLMVIKNAKVYSVLGQPIQ